MQFHEFLQELTKHYGTAGTCPGIMCSHIENGQTGTMMYYVAVQCFPTGKVDSRKIVARATDESIGAALHKLYTLWKQKCAEGDDGGVYTGGNPDAGGSVKGYSENMQADMAKLAAMGVENAKTAGVVVADGPAQGENQWPLK